MPAIPSNQTNMDQPPATLYLVATPIGNLEDITLRALRVLKEVDFIFAEDTRHTKKLLMHYGIQKPVISFHDHSSPRQLEKIFQPITQGKSIAYVTDAGTPGIADPGYIILKNAIERDVPVVVLPGPVAAIIGLVGSGLPMDRFIFEGFLPFKSGKRQNKLKQLISETRTIIFYESPHRIIKTLQDILEVMGDRKICLARELTKKFEEYLRGNVTDVIEHFEKVEPKGEFTIIVTGSLKEKNLTE